MKRMKRTVALLASAAMAFSLVACGGTTSSSTATSAAPSEDTTVMEDITLSVAWWGGATRNERIEQTLELYAEQNPNVTFSTAANNFSDHQTAMSTAAASGDLPDMWLIQTQLWMGEYVENGQLLDLTPYIESGALDTTNVSDLESGRASDGKVYAIAAGLTTPGVQYNKTLLEENGIEIKNGMTVEEFAQKCAEIYEKTGVKTAINNAESFIEYLLRADGKLLYDDGKLGVDSYEDLLPYFELMERGRNEGWLLDYETYVTAGGDSATQPVVTGESWCAMWNANQMAGLQDPCPEGVVLDMVTWPTEDLEASGWLVGTMGWVIPANVEDPDAAVALLNWWINSQEVQEIMLGEMGVPVNSEAANAIIPLLGDSSARAFTYVLEEVVPHSSPKNPVGGTGSTQVRSLIDELHEAMYYGSMTAEEGAQRLFDEGNAAMAAG
jgi:multiple sugar transport system substrate-binding protein